MQPNYLKGKKILFANFPADGHFNPLTGLAIYLANKGADVRWYTSKAYSKKIQNLGFPHYRFKKALEVSNNEIDKVFPDRTKIKSQLSKLKFDIINVFVLRGPEYYQDIRELYREFQFDLMVCDCAFTGSIFVKELMNIPVIAIGVLPLSNSSKDLPPAGLGMAPSHNIFGKIKEAILRKLTDRVIFGKPNKVLWKVCDEYRIPHNRESVFDMLASKADYFLQSGAPGFEFRRSDMLRNIRFMGPLLPKSRKQNDQPQWFDERLNKYQKVVLVTQGTVETDASKLLIPALEGFKDTNILLVVTTGGSMTAALKEKYPHKNIIIEDFIPFDDVMPYADVYITNGGFGGVMLGIENRLPLVVAGLHEGKNDICARVGYFKIGINLKTERPAASQLLGAVYKVLKDPQYKENVERLSDEFLQYDPEELMIKYTTALFRREKRKKVQPVFMRIPGITGVAS